MNASSDKSNSIPRNTTDETRFICDKEITDGRWFCKIPQKEKPVLLSCPQCALRYFDKVRPATNGDERDRASFEQSLHFLVGQEQP